MRVLTATNTQWGLEAIWQRVVPQLPGLTLEVLPELDSSNSELMRRSHAGHNEPVLLVVERQSAGRGRRGRHWHAEPQDSLMFSLGLALSPPQWSGLSLAVGLSLAHSLHPDIRLKWPNDLWCEERKLGGILIETATIRDAAAHDAARRYVVVGVGLNLRTPAQGDFSVPAAGLDGLLGACQRPAVLAQVFEPLVQTLLAFERSGFAPWQAAYAARDALWQRAVQLSDGIQGVAQGVDAEGALLVRTTGGVQRVNSSEVSVRPAPDLPSSAT